MLKEKTNRYENKKFKTLGVYKFLEKKYKKYGYKEELEHIKLKIVELELKELLDNYKEEEYLLNNFDEMEY